MHFFLFVVRLNVYVQILPHCQMFSYTPSIYATDSNPPPVKARQPLVGQALLPIETFTNTLRHTILGRIPLDE